MKKNALHLLLLGTLTLTALLMASCGSKGKQKQDQLTEYPVIQIDTASVVVYSDFASELQSGVVVEIRPRVSGYIDRIYIKEGTHVTKGQQLFQINTDDLVEEYNASIANVDAARAQVENAKLEVRKLTPLVEKGIISNFELSNANSNLLAAEARLKYAESQSKNANINLKYATITSPVDGVVGRIVVREGTLVGSNNADPLTTISGDGDVSAYFAIDESSMLNLAAAIEGKTMDEKVRKMENVNLIMANGQTYPYAGRLELASGLVDLTTGSMQIKGVFPNPENLLRSGSSGVVRISTPMKGAVVVPQKATYELQDKVMVYGVDGAGNIQAKKIEINGVAGKLYVVSKGLQPGDTILYDGLDYIKGGDMIKPFMISLDSLINKQ